MLLQCGFKRSWSAAPLALKRNWNDCYCTLLNDWRYFSKAGTKYGPSCSFRRKEFPLSRNSKPKRIKKKIQVAHHIYCSSIKKRLTNNVLHATHVACIVLMLLGLLCLEPEKRLRRRSSLTKAHSIRPANSGTPWRPRRDVLSPVTTSTEAQSHGPDDKVKGCVRLCHRGHSLNTSCLPVTRFLTY